MFAEVNPDLQGADLRHSCLADHLEFQAIIGGSSFSEKELADRIENSSWLRILSPRLSTDPAINHDKLSLGDYQDKCLDVAQQIFGLIDQRQQILGDAYPFERKNFSKIHLKHEEGSYLWLLALSLAHGHNLALSEFPHRSFETAVTAAINGVGMDAFNIGTATGGSFDETLGQIQGHFSCLAATPDNVRRSLSANDGGGDTIAMLPIENDVRHGHWIFVGQSTVGKSDSWCKKIHEVKTEMWRNSFADRVIAIPFFATPYHVSDHYLQLLVNNEQRCIWDRLRLCQFLTPDGSKTREALAVLRRISLI